jgi:A/G-specific adenine glycosylase
MGYDTRKNALVREKVIEWYTQHGRNFPWRNTTDPYQILIAETLLRRTTASAVARVFNDFLSRFDTLERLARARESTIARALVSLGLHSLRAKQLRKTASLIMKEHNGEIPRAHETLLSLPGVGQYIASAVRNFAFGDAVPLLDGNMIHFLSRVYGTQFIGPTDNKALEFVTQFGGSHQAELYWGIIDLVATICLRRSPRCSICPVSMTCEWFSVK